MKVSIIIPWLRNESLKRTISLCHKNHGIDEIEIVSEEDKERIGCPEMVKLLAGRAKHDLICFLGDDTLPQEKFLRNACISMENLRDEWGLVGLNDLSGRFLPTHWIAHKKLLPFLGGEFFHTGYHHCCCDVELMERCIELGKYIFSRWSVVKHDHPIFTHKPADEHYLRAYSKQEQDRELLLKRRANGWKS